MPTKISTLALLAVLFLVLFFVLSQFNAGNDWTSVFRPSTVAFLSGENPYIESGFYNPPWVFLALVPMALLPPAVGSIIFSILGAGGYLLAFYRLKIRLVGVAFLVATPAFLTVLLNPNFDWAVILGYTLPPQIGLFFVLIKPQISAPLVIYWLVDSWRTGGYRETLRLFSPVAITYAVSFLFFGPWILHLGGARYNLSNTANVWPWGLLAGAVLLVISFRRRQQNLSLIAGPFFSPYLAPYSWLPAITVLPGGNIEIIVACIAYWIVWLITIL